MSREDYFSFGASPKGGGAASNQFDADDWQEAPSTAETQGRIPAPLAVVDPFETSVFPTPQTPVKMKPRPSQAQLEKSPPPALAPATAMKAPAPSAAAAAASSSSASDPAGSPIVHKRCAFSGCDNDRFARGYCAMHLSDIGSNPSATGSIVAATPTTKIRNTYKLWSKTINIDRDTNQNTCTWHLLHNDDAHTIVLHDNPFYGTREVTINGKEVYRGEPEIGAWQLEATIGHSFRTSLALRIDVQATGHGYAYELYVDDLKFDDAHAAFLAKLSGVTQLQRLQLSEKQGKDGSSVRGEQLQASLYIHQNWNSHTDEERTRVGATKSRVSWSFTIRGGKHVVVLEYSSMSGKKKVMCDGEVVIEKKPSMLSANKHKAFKHSFSVDGVECTVTAARNKAGLHDPRDPPEADPRPFLFGFLIDGVPFESCQQTEGDLAGGNIGIDSITAQQVVPAPAAAAASSPVADPAPVTKRPVAVQGGRRNSVHKPLSAEEYEAALREENERQRKAEDAEKDKRAADAAAAFDKSAPASHGSKPQPIQQLQSDSDSSSDEED